MGSRPTDAPGLRTVFVAARAPRRPMDRVTVSSIVARSVNGPGWRPWARTCCGTRWLGEEMVRAEVRLPAIGQVLRHHDPLTTANYESMSTSSAALPFLGPQEATGDDYVDTPCR